MTLRIYLIRHALAAVRDGDRWPDDNERPLTKVGVRYFKKVAEGLEQAAPVPDRVLSSPSLRAWQTAELLTDIGWPSPEVLAALLPGGEPREVVGALPREGRVALVGHGPDLGRLASFLLTEDADRLSIEVKKGAVIAIEIDSDTAQASLKWLASPSMLRRMR